ncbi:hypothetical protein FHS43_003869 [Streptosporangium becharense]|uniref:Uncharacterized protein n=1 Tax=Streptosporangium becharense TaxID=1816182 RepID=A0A7W9IIB4_9ACTN|nr:hypothetical protein [Streptosporangium becharense]MBB2912586.1 hypothetical protein [Streptosporangium becharense]MBB5820584.1 hypothetical protein [Streptosporangium becharense]
MIENPPGWRFLTAVTIAAFISLWWSSVPFPYFEGLIFGFFVWVPLSFYWIIRLCAAFWNGRRRLSMKPLLRWLPAPLIVLAVWGVIHLDGSFRVRFTLSQSSMEQYARSIIGGGGHADPGCRWTGAYHVCGRYVGEDEGVPPTAQLDVSDWPLAPSRCFAWTPDGRLRAEDYEYGLRHLTGSWWGCREWDGW